MVVIGKPREEKKERKEKISSNWVEKDVGLRSPLTMLQEVILVELTNVGGGKLVLSFNFEGIYSTFFLLNKTVAGRGHYLPV